MEAIQRGELDARIQFVFCNRDPGDHAGSDEFMALVKSYGLPLMTLSSQALRQECQAPDFASVRGEFDRQVLDLLAPYSPDICVLAGYGLIFGPEVVRRYTLLNLHPALPGGPIGTWQQVIWQLIEARAPETGTMMHVGTEELDRGPSLTYFSLPLVGDSYDRLWRQVRGRSIEAIKADEGEELPLFQKIRQETVRRERPLLLETLKALADGRVRVVDGQAVDAKGIAIGGLCLNREVERAVLA